MSKFISGNDLLKRWDIFGFELVKYVKRGLLPHNQAGRPRLPGFVEEQLIQLQNQAKYWGKQKLNQLLTKQSNQKFIDIVKESADTIRNIKDLRSKLLRDPTSVWENFSQSIDDEKAKAEIKTLVNSYYELDQVAELEKKLGPIGSNKKLRPNQKAKDACRKVAEKLWKKDHRITIAQMINHEEMLEVSKKTDGSFYVEKTIRDWIKDLCPNRAPGRRKHT